MTFAVHMSPVLNGSTVLQHFEHGNTIKICNGFDLYLRLPHLFGPFHTKMFVFFVRRIIRKAENERKTT